MEKIIDGKTYKIQAWPSFCTDELPEHWEFSGYERDRKIAAREKSVDMD